MMIEKFKEFLSRSPYRLDTEQREKCASMVAETLGPIICEWHDPHFGEVWAKDFRYYERARESLIRSSEFRRSCHNSGEVLQALRYLIDFFIDETRKAGLGKTARKPTKEDAPNNDGVKPVGASDIVVLEEGELKELHVSVHERNVELRRKCIEQYRTLRDGKVICEACEMSFGERYGKIGDGYIEVHHLRPISQSDGAHVVDPKTDLVPLCANCHAMIHRLMAAEERRNGASVEGTAALEKLREIIEERK